MTVNVENISDLVKEDVYTKYIMYKILGVFSSISGTFQSIPFLNPDADASILTQRGFNWFFRTGPTSRIYSEKLFDMLGKTEFSDVTLGFLSENSLLGQDEVQALINLSRKYRHKITIIELFEAITNNQLYSIKSSNQDMLVIPQAEEDDLKTIRILKEIGYCPLAYLDQTGFFAIARAHSESPRDIRRSLVNTDIPGSTLILPWDGIHFDENGQNIFADSMVLQVLNKTNKIDLKEKIAFPSKGEAILFNTVFNCNN